jgi:hypothetical protein
MLLDGVPEDAAHVHQCEVRVELLRVEGARAFGHPEIVLASNFN